MAPTCIRRSKLKSRYCFECQCELCKDADRDDSITQLACPRCKSTKLTEQTESVVQSTTTNRINKVICPRCSQHYNRDLVNQLIDYLVAFADKEPTVDSVLEAVAVVRCICEIESKSPNRLIRQISQDFDNKDIFQHLALFHHPDNIYFTLACRHALNACLVEMSDEVLSNAPSRQQLIQTLIGCCYNQLISWTRQWQPWIGLERGLGAYNMAGFLLRYIGDSQLAAPLATVLLGDSVGQSSVSCMAEWLSSELVPEALKFLKPFAPYRPDWSQGLERLQACLWPIA